MDAHAATHTHHGVNQNGFFFALNHKGRALKLLDAEIATFALIVDHHLHAFHRLPMAAVHEAGMFGDDHRHTAVFSTREAARFFQ